MRTRAIALLVCGELLSSCASQASKQVKGYAGADLPADQLALLKPALSTQIFAIDGDKTKLFSGAASFGPANEWEIGLPPGPHTLTLRWSTGSAWTDIGDETFAAQAGHKYLAVGTYSQGTWGSQAGMRVKIEILDVTNKEGCWTVAAKAENCR